MTGTFRAMSPVEKSDALPTERARDSLLLASVVLFASHMVAASTVAFPTTAALAKRIHGFGSDATIFDAGGLRALELLDGLRRSVPGYFLSSSLVMAVFAVLGLLPLAMAIASLTRRTPLELARASVKSFVGLLLLFGVATLLETILAIVAILSLRALGGHGPTSNPREALLISLGTDLLVFTPLLLLGVLHDVARCVLVSRALGFYDAAARALRVAGKRPFALLGHYLARGILAVALVGIALGVVLAVGMRSPGALCLSASSELVALFGVAFLRASWLGRVVSLDRSIPDDPASFQDDDSDVADSKSPALSSAASEVGSPGSSVGRAED